MRAWLLLLAVLATFKLFVQVASTEETASTIFVRAITPQKEHIYNTFDSTSVDKATRTELTTREATLTALVKPFSKDFDMKEMTVSENKSKTSKFSNENNNSDNEIIDNRLSSALETQHQEEKHSKQNHHHQKHATTTQSKSSPATATTTTQQSHLSKAPTEESIHLSDSSSPAAAASSLETSSTDSEDEPATYSNKEEMNEKVKPDPELLVKIKIGFLSALFNNKLPPKIDRSKVVIPEAMKKLYEEIMHQKLDSVHIPKPGLLTKSANKVTGFKHQESKIDHRFPHHHRFRLYFDIKSIDNEKLKAAELQLSRDAISHAALNPDQASRTRYQVLVYDITRVGIRGKREPSYVLLDNKTIRLNSTDTVSVDVQPAVERWLANPKANYGLLIEVRTMGSLKPAPHHHVRIRRSADESHENWQRKEPLLLTYTDDERHESRSIRDVSKRSKRRRKTHQDCRRHALFVDFADVGWSDWILAPQGYDAFYCSGNCPFGLSDHLNTTNHAVVQTLVNNLNPAKVPKPCCVPTELDGIAMLYMNDQNTVVVKNYQDMAVIGCGCR